MLQSCLDDLFRTGGLNLGFRLNSEILIWSAVHGATALIIEGHLPRETFESVLDGLERSIGIRNK